MKQLDVYEYQSKGAVFACMLAQYYEFKCHIGKNLHSLAFCFNG